MIDNSKLYSELQIIINQQSILSQKVGILLAINIFFIPIISSIPLTTNIYWLFFLLIPTLFSMAINIYILFPKFGNKKVNKKSKYFFDFADMEEKEIEDYITKENDVNNQIKSNSIILKRKYKYYMHSLSLQFFGMPYLFLFKKNK